MGKIKDSNSVIDTKRTFRITNKMKLSLLLTTCLGFYFGYRYSYGVTQYLFLSLFTAMSITSCFFIIKYVIPLLTAKTTLYESEKLGKYYDPSKDYNTLLQKERDNRDIKTLEEKWYNAMDNLKEQIRLYESNMLSAETTENKLTIQSQLQPMYEKFKVAGDFAERFNSPNNLPLLKDLYRNGNFVTLKEAETLKTKYDNIIYCSTPVYHDKALLLSIIQVVSMFFGPIIFTQLIMAFIYEISLKFEYSFFWALFESYMLWGFLSPVLVPVSFFFWWWALPTLLEKIVLRGHSPEEDAKKTKQRLFGVAAGSAFYLGSLWHHTKKNK